MVARRWLVRAYVFAVVVSVIAFTLAYDAGMTLLENRPRSLLESFEFVMQTLTTTGYGQDAPWGTAMTVLVIGIQIASLVLIFAAFPIVIVPLVEDALATSPPTELEDVRDHVLICSPQRAHRDAARRTRRSGGPGGRRRTGPGDRDRPPRSRRRRGPR